VALDAWHHDPALAWAASGGMWLTGWPAEAPLVPTGALLERASWAGAEMAAAATSWGRPVAVDVGALLFGRAALMGLVRRGRHSANSSCRLLHARDGWLALTLARPDDLAAVPAIVGGEVRGDPWAALASTAADQPAASVVDQAQLLGVPAAVLASPAARPSTVLPAEIVCLGEPAPAPERPLVLDLSSMWAGPLTAKLLGLCGATVVKVESTRRPDGARFGHPGFWSWLHNGHESVRLDLSTATGVAELVRLVGLADVVIESSRPRALQELGIVAEAVVAARSGRTWVSITGYGREGESGRRVAFGDDAAVAGGLVAYDERGDPVFCGDAIADPLTGLVAAAAAARAIADGGGRLVAAAMADAAAWAAAPAAAGMPAYRTVPAGAGRWVVHAGFETQEVLRPSVPGAGMLVEGGVDGGSFADRGQHRLR
jgi:CoA-transferase family III